MNQDSQAIIDKIDNLSKLIEVMDAKLSKQIESVDVKLSKQIESVDVKLSKQIESVESKLSQEISQVRTAVMEMSEDIEAILDMYKDQHLRLHKLENRFKVCKASLG